MPLRTDPPEPPEEPLFVPSVIEILNDTAIGDGRNEWIVNGVILRPRRQELEYRLEEAFDPFDRNWPENVKLTEDDIE